MKENRTVVCDIGASSIKIGFAGSLTPEHVVPTIVAYPRQQLSPSSKTLLGKQALNVPDRKKYNFHHPIDEHGLVQNWSGLEALLAYCLEEIGVLNDCSRYKVLITKPHNMKSSDLQCLLNLFFFKFDFGAVTMHEQAALVLYTQGVETGIVVELGESMATIVPVYKGHAISTLNKRMAIGGRSISKFLMKLLRLRGYHMDAREDLETAREIKEQECYVALDPNVEQRLAEETTILEEKMILRDGTTVSIGKERFEAAEVLFQPKLWDSEKSGLADLIFETIQEADIDCRVDLYQNIILSGGSSLLPGIQERLELDLNERYTKDVLRGNKRRTPRHWKPQVHAPETRQFMVFEGAALFADLISGDAQFWVHKSEYKMEGGVQMLLGKCQVF